MSRYTVPTPANFYYSVDGLDYDNIWVVGDIHGQYDKLMKALDEVNFDTQCDLLISVGDIIDRGPQSREMLDMLANPWFIVARGNHEDFAIASVTDIPGNEDALYLWLNNGGMWFLDTTPGDERDRVIDQIRNMAELPYVIEVSCLTQKVVISHSCYPREVYRLGKPVSGFDVVWDRTRYLNRFHGDKTHTKGADLFVHGHNHTEEVESYGNHRYIATGTMSVNDNPLTLLQIQ